MKTPPLLLGATLLFWGWQTGLPIFGAVMAVILEGSRAVRARWEFSPTEFNRVWNFCAVLFLGALVYLFTVGEGASGVSGIFGAKANRIESLNQTTRSVLLLFQWMPLAFFPLAAAQAFSRHDQVDLAAFSSWVRRRERLARARPGATAPPGRALNVSHLYFAVCLLAASAVRKEPLVFYGGLSALLAWALWPARSRRFPPVVWGALAAVVIASGYAGHLGLKQLQKIAEGWDTALLSRFARRGFDAKESRTSLGAIGRLKLSGRIVLRLDAHGQAPPELLREASYHLFRAPLWYNGRKDFQQVLAESDGATWTLLPQKPAKKSLTVSCYLDKGAGLLAVPHGLSQLERLPVGTLETNRLGVVKVDGGPGLVSYEARYDDGATIDGASEKEDREVPESERAAVSQIASELRLAAQAPPQILKTVSGFFQNHFQYSTWLAAAPSGPTNRTALAHFLLSQRAGHCEYFATATVLLLRQAGIPARYAVGYSVQEKSGKKFVVRERHAHAWCLVYHDGAWRDFDTTPGSWSEIEHRHASFWEPMSDAWSRLWFEFSKWRWSENSYRKYAAWLVLALLLGLVARFFFAKRWTRFREVNATRPAAVWPGLDSEFYLIERRLIELGLERRSGETLSAWLERIEVSAPAAVRPLREVVPLHYRHRFDPNGLSAAERAALKSEAQGWLAQNGKAPASR